MASETIFVFSLFLLPEFTLRAEALRSSWTYLGRSKALCSRGNLNLLFVRNVLKAEEGAVNCWAGVIGLCVNKGDLKPKTLITFSYYFSFEKLNSLSFVDFL